MREFSDLSIKNWVAFIKSFTTPKLDQAEQEMLGTHIIVIEAIGIHWPQKNTKLIMARTKLVNCSASATSILQGNSEGIAI